MNQGSRRSTCFCLMSTTLPCLLLLFLSFSGSAVAYKNYTVGDSLGWFDNTEKSNVNYQKWADSKEFSLGDFLIFNTDTNHSVIQTYNVSTYKLCDYDDSQDKDTTQWSVSDPSNTQTHPVTVAVPLMKEGSTYFFSGDYDGDQCKSGQHFQINVTHGQGLPKSLRNSPEDAPSPASPISGDDESAPDTIVPANFNHPKDEQSEDDDDDDKGSKNKKSSSVSLSIYSQLHMVLFGTLLFLF